MPQFAGHIEVIAKRGGPNREFSIKVDGEEFPYYISDLGVMSSVATDRPPAITVEILAEKVTIIDDYGA